MPAWTREFFEQWAIADETERARLLAVHADAIERLSEDARETFFAKLREF